MKITQVKMLLHNRKFFINSRTHGYIQFYTNFLIFLLFTIAMNADNVKLPISQFNNGTSPQPLISVHVMN